MNIYEKLGNCHVKNNLPLSDWLSQIKYSEYSDSIEAARHDGEIDELKSVLPCITYNFLFNKYKEDANIISSTGYLYIDIDVPDFDIDSLDKNKVYTYYKSIRLKGYGLLVRVEGLTLSNFNATYKAVIDDLGLIYKFDKKAKKASQFSVLSYDPDIFINENSKVYQALEDTNSVRSSVVLNKSNTYTTDVRTPLRFDDTNEIPIPDNERLVTNWEEGFQVVKAFLPFRRKGKLTDNRYNTLLAFGGNVLKLNPILTKNRLFEIIRGAEAAICDKPQDEKRIRGIVNSLFKYLKAGTLKTIPFNKPRRIIYKPGEKFSKGEKQELNIIEMAKGKAYRSKKKLTNIIETWNFQDWGLISQRKICKYGKMSNSTLIKYVKPFQPRIDELNKNNISVYSSVVLNKSNTYTTDVYTPKLEITMPYDQNKPKTNNTSPVDIIQNKHRNPFHLPSLYIFKGGKESLNGFVNNRGGGKNDHQELRQWKIFNKGLPAYQKICFQNKLNFQDREHIYYK